MRLKFLAAGCAFGCAFVLSAPVFAQVRAVPVQPASEREALRGVDVYFVNEGNAPVPAQGPREIEVTAADGTRLVLSRLPGPEQSVAPGGFARLRYAPVATAGVAVSPAEAYPPAPLPQPGETVVQSASGSSSGFFDRFEPHDPVYGVVGAGDAGVKLQFSFAFRPIESDGPLGHLRLAYTQTMFWDFWADSGPFTNTIYNPELYAEVPAGENTTVAFGYRHDSNGGDLTDSVDLNRVFARVEHRLDLGSDWHLDIVPEAWFFIDRPALTPDLADYFGYTSLTAALWRENGLKISVTGRGSFETGHGAAEMFVSYPLARISDTLGFYLFAQGFTGYGETLEGYRRNDSHARIGIALTR